MGAQAEALATKFEAKAAEATAVLERLTEADWGRPRRRRGGPSASWRTTSPCPTS